MANIISNKYNQFIERFKLQPFKEIIIFMAIITGFHLFWNFWGFWSDYKIFGVHVIKPTVEPMLIHLRIVSAWIANNLLGISTIVEDELLIHEEVHHMGVTWGCAGIKQIIMFFVLMLIYPGPWKKKLWFIPLGLLAVHLTNLFRIISLYAIVIYKIEWFTFTHDWILRPFFYVVMFLLWVWWVEKLSKPKSISSENL